MLSQRVTQLVPYVAGEQPQDKRYIKLNTNENPYPPTPRIRQFLTELDPSRLRLYPDPLSAGLREAIGDYYGLSADQVFVGNGSDEVLSFIFYAFFDPERGPVLFPQYTYSFYPVYADFYQIPSRRIPNRPDLSIDMEAMIKAAPSACGLIFPNPNAPTGIALPRSEIRRLLKACPSDRAIVIDEAYIDFGGESACPILNEFPNLIIVNTYSKSLCLAGMRIGFVLAHPHAIEALFRVKDSFNSYPLDRLAQEIGRIAIQDRDYYQGIRQTIRQTRTQFAHSLAAQGWELCPSLANFVFARKPGIEGETIYREFKQAGILVRHFRTPGIQDYLRITIGLPEEMERLLETDRRLFPG
ncbi:MAG: histidinol-phosphate transaminase [Candidatus Delongbacteria bacterium]|nr:histidinol-phosphate transaminase [Candidatus Delongbacteria bacterium]